MDNPRKRKQIHSTASTERETLDQQPMRHTDLLRRSGDLTLLGPVEAEHFAVKPFEVKP